jgi:hypothetical protein
MKKFITAAVGSALIALAMTGAAGASGHHMRKHPVVVVNGDSRDAVLYYPGWGRDPVPVYGVYPGLVYGGAASAPAKR